MLIYMISEMKATVPEQSNSFTYIIRRVSSSTLPPHPLPTSHYWKLLLRAMHKKRNNLDLLVRELPALRSLLLAVARKPGSKSLGYCSSMAPCTAVSALQPNLCAGQCQTTCSDNKATKCLRELWQFLLMRGIKSLNRVPGFKATHTATKPPSGAQGLVPSCRD